MDSASHIPTPAPTAYLTPDQIAEEIGISADLARKVFAKVKGVLRVGAGEQAQRFKIRVPRPVFEQWKAESTVRERQPAPNFRRQRRAKAALRVVSRRALSPGKAGSI